MVLAVLGVVLALVGGVAAVVSNCAVR